MYENRVHVLQLLKINSDYYQLPSVYFEWKVKKFFLDVFLSQRNSKYITAYKANNIFGIQL